MDANYCPFEKSLLRYEYYCFFSIAQKSMLKEGIKKNPSRKVTDRFLAEFCSFTTLTILNSRVYCIKGLKNRLKFKLFNLNNIR